MANMRITYSEFEETASYLTQGGETLITLLKSLKDKVDELVSSGFITDKASPSLIKCYDEFNKGATETADGLNGIADFLRNTRSSLENLDASLAAKLTEGQ